MRQSGPTRRRVREKGGGAHTGARMWQVQGKGLTTTVFLPVRKKESVGDRKEQGAWKGIQAIGRVIRKKGLNRKRKGRKSQKITKEVESADQQVKDLISMPSAAN